MKFVKFWLEYGNKTGNKISPERAEAIMKIVGTQEGFRRFPDDPYLVIKTEGKPYFSFIELLDCFQLRSYSSKPVSYVEKLIEKAKKKRNTALATEVEEELAIVEEDWNDRRSLFNRF